MTELTQTEKPALSKSCRFYELFWISVSGIGCPDQTGAARRPVFAYAEGCQWIFIVDKTAAQVEQEQCLGKLFADANVSLHPMEQVETVFLSVPSHMQELLLHTFEQSDLFAGQILTIVRTCNGLLIYTEDKKQLLSLLNRLINQQ